MENELDTSEFDFNKKLQTPIISEESKLTPNALKNIKFAAFLMLGGLAIGGGLNITNGWMDGYKVTQESNARIKEIITKNEQIVKLKREEINLVVTKAQKEAETKAAQIKAVENSKIKLDIDKKEYGIWLANKDDMIHNYENQLLIYDQAYQITMRGVKEGVLGLDKLATVREFYQAYKKDINEYIVYINDTTVSFDHYHSLNEENRKFIKNEMLKYQSGDLNRNSDLETLLLNNFSKNDNDKKDTADLRNKMRNDMIDALADLMNNNHENTKTKKLKM